MLAGLVENEMTWAGTFRRLLIEESQVAGLGIERECANGADLLALEVGDLAYRIEELVIGMNGEEGGVLGLDSQDCLRGLGIGQIQLKAINALALALGIGSDVNPELVVL